MRTVEPAGAEDVAAMLADAAGRERFVIRGGGTKSDWGMPAAPADVLLSTARLNRIVAHRFGDLTATVEAGAALDAVNRELAKHGQWIPLDPPWPDRATIGGIVATNDHGPRRHRYGAPRDLIIGIELARADGVRAKAGGIVVKNVAGYDVARLATGSFGCLGVILSATFKLYPLPQASRTVIADLPSHAAVGALVAALAASQLTPTAVEIQMPPLRMLVRFESIEASVDRQSGTVVSIVEHGGGSARIVADRDEAREWQLHAARPWQASGTIARLSALPADIVDVLDLVTRVASGCTFEIVGRAGLGALLLGLDGAPAAQVRAITAIRERLPAGRGSLVVLRASDEVKSLVDVWGPMGDAFRVMQSVKRAFDPRGILNPGRGPGGL